MIKHEATWQEALAAREDLQLYTDNAIGLFALSLRFGLDDVHSVAAESITDGHDDKKCDLIFIEKEQQVAVLAQCYFSNREKSTAPANKASDLNTAVAWLLERSIDDLPDRLRPAATELREAISEGLIKRFEIWYVHNLPESKCVGDELTTVQATAKSILTGLQNGSGLSVCSKEIGRGSLEELYRETLSPILVNEEIAIEIDGGFEIKGEKWSAYVTAVPAKSLFRLYNKHKTKLFSANVRDYLGSRKSDANINHGIKRTAQSEPGDFWVFNNGITVLTHQFRISEGKNGKLVLERVIDSPAAMGRRRKRRVLKLLDGQKAVPERHQHRRVELRGALPDVDRRRGPAAALPAARSVQRAALAGPRWCTLAIAAQ